MLLPEKFLQIAWPHAGGERLAGQVRGVGLSLEQSFSRRGHGAFAAVKLSRHCSSIRLRSTPSLPGEGYDGAVKDDTRKDVVARLKSIQGHLRGVEKMVQEDKYCVDVLRQTMAIEKAMQRVDELILEGHLETCVADSFREGRSKATVGELLDIFKTARG